MSSTWGGPCLLPCSPFALWDEGVQAAHPRILTWYSPLEFIRRVLSTSRGWHSTVAHPPCRERHQARHTFPGPSSISQPVSPSLAQTLSRCRRHRAGPGPL